MGRSVTRLLYFNIGFVTLFQKLRAILRAVRSHFLQDFCRTFASSWVKIEVKEFHYHCVNVSTKSRQNPMEYSNIRMPVQNWFHSILNLWRTNSMWFSFIKALWLVKINFEQRSEVTAFPYKHSKYLTWGLYAWEYNM